MAISEITEVRMEEDGDRYVYAVSTREACTGDIAVILSTTRPAVAENALKADCEWNISTGSVSVEKGALKDVTELFLYLKDTRTRTVGCAVRVYCEPLALNRWCITGDGAIAFWPERGENAYEFSDGLVLFYANRRGYGQYVPLNLTDARIMLDRLDIWSDTESFSFRLGYYMEDEQAKIYGALCPQTTLYIAPPDVEKTVYTDGKLYVTGRFVQGPGLYGRFYQGGHLLREGFLADGMMELSASCPDERENGMVEVCYATDQGRSLYSGAKEVIMKKPEVESCRFKDGKATVTMRRAGLYAVDCAGTNAVVSGASIQVAADARQLRIGYVRGSAYGPIVNCQIKERAIYPFLSGEETFYAVCDRPDDCSLTEDILVELAADVQEETVYAGSCFEVRRTEGKTCLTMRKEIFTSAKAQAWSDYRAMLRAVAARTQLYREIRRAVAAKLPMRAQEVLFYAYDYCPEDGYVGIYEGMSLSTEYTVYQNIPDAKQASADLSGFAGTGTASYQVVRRDGRLKIEPFAGSMNFVVTPPRDIGSDNRLCGGAGVVDLLYRGFPAAYMRLVYPAQFTERTSTGNLCYDRNICLLSSQRPDILEEAVDNMRRGALAVDGVAYHYFRGRAVVVPKIRILAAGGVLEVSLGTRLCDVEQMFGWSKSRLYRMVGGEKIPFYQKDNQIPLMAGDCVECGFGC